MMIIFGYSCHDVFLMTRLHPRDSALKRTTISVTEEFPCFCRLSLALNESFFVAQDDPWQDILYAADAGGFCEVPVSLLRRLRKEGEVRTEGER